MRAFHNDITIKELYLARVRQHRAADELIHGTYWENGRGCAVGCTIHSGDHAAYEDELGIPLVLACLEDDIFENLPNAKAMEWPEAFLSSIAVGADLEPISDQLMIWLLMDHAVGLIHFVIEEARPAIEHVAVLYERRLAGETITEDQWLDARRAIAAASDNAFLAAFARTLTDNPRAVADAAVHAVVAYAATQDDQDDALKDRYMRMSEKLLELLESAPVPAEM